MRVLMINDWGFIRGGAETHISVLMDALRKRGIESDLYVPCQIPLAEKLNTFLPDIIHIHNWVYWTRNQDLIFKTSLPTVLSLHDYLIVCPRRMRLWPGHICATPCDKSCTEPFVSIPNCHKVVFNHYSQAIFCAQGVDCDVIPHGINLERWPYGTGKRDGIGFVSVFQGAWWKGEMVARKIAHRLNVPIRIINGGSTPVQVSDLMRSVKILLYPAVYAETFGMVIAEAMASGAVVIAYDVAGGQRALIRDGETGYLVEARNELKLFEKTKEVLCMDNSSVGATARQMIEQYYTAERMAMDWEKLYLSF